MAFCASLSILGGVFELLVLFCFLFSFFRFFCSPDIVLFSALTYNVSEELSLACLECFFGVLCICVGRV